MKQFIYIYFFLFNYSFAQNDSLNINVIIDEDKNSCDLKHITIPYAVALVEPALPTDKIIKFDIEI